MSQASNTSDQQNYGGLLGYFDPGVLASYQNQPDKYVVRDDDYDGQVQLADHYAMQLLDADIRGEGINVRFTFRRQRNGEDALVAFLPDLAKYSPSHIKRWQGFRISDPEWPDTEDQRFVSWKRRNLDAEWDVDNGEISQLEEVIGIINALTNEVVSLPLFKYEANPVLTYPSAENDHRYEDAHQELYRFLVDGLNKDGIKAIAEHRGLTIKIGSARTIDALKKALPDFPEESALWVALDNIAAQRRRASHSVRARAKSFSAKETFKEDLSQCLAGLEELLIHLEDVLHMSAQLASERQSTKRLLPLIVDPPEHHYSINRITEAVGKTIERVEVGTRKDYESTNASEAIIIHFTDGSIIGIETGSNAANLAWDRDDLAPNDFRVDFQIVVVPSPRDHSS
jgi:hypothetical protein